MQENSGGCSGILEKGRSRWTSTRGLIVVRDEAIIRVLCPNDALALANAVIQTVIRFRRRTAVGPSSSEEDI
jgi:hypothetical protein